jgi:hypothetical protein
VGRNLNATLDISGGRLALRELSRGLSDPGHYFSGFDVGSAPLGSHRNLGDKLMSVLDDHDHVYGEKLRFAARAVNDHQAAAATAILLLTLGIPCFYYGTEQGFAGPEEAERFWLPGWGGHDRYLREAMFGPRFPRAQGLAGVAGLGGGDGLDHELPGFGPFGTAGAHCFDPDHPLYLRTAAIAAIHAEFPVLRSGRQHVRTTYRKPIGVDDTSTCDLSRSSASRSAHRPGSATIRTTHQPGSARNLTPQASSLTVIMNSAQAGGAAAGDHPIGSQLPVRRAVSGAAYAVPAARSGQRCGSLLVNRP